MKIFYLLFLVFLFMSCAERGNEEKKVMILGVTPEQIAKVKESYTGKFLGPVLEQTKKFMKAAQKKK